MASKGFLFYAKGEEFVKQAILSAMSIRVTNKDILISIMTNDDVDPKFNSLFDNIIPVPWVDNDNTFYQINNRWKTYHATPYDQTIVLDTDTLVLQNIDMWWKFLNNYDLFFLTKAYSYRKEVITSNYYRKAFEKNNLPNIYTGFHFIKKSDFSHEFFKWLELVTHNWELFYGSFCKEYYPKYPSYDLSVAIVNKILNCTELTTNLKTDLFEFVHMKPYVQGWKYPGKCWINQVGSYLTDDLNLLIGNYKQTGVFHYTENDFVTDQILSKYERYLGYE